MDIAKNSTDKDSAANGQPEKVSPEVARGKKAIEAAKVSSAENDDSESQQQEEKKDASEWRNEG